MNGLVHALHRVVGGHDLDESEAFAAVDVIMAGEGTDAQIGGLLTALRMKGETLDEVTGAARAMRARVVPVRHTIARVVDTCGTGGDGAHTFNVSTAVALVVAAAGAHVAKHGNRAVSSAVGSADVLEALGVNIDLSPDGVERCLVRTGLGFMFAPRHHGALKHAATTRRQLGFRTIFNLLGPLTNPAGATHQLLGIFDGRKLGLIAQVLGRLGLVRALVVHGPGGLDELGLDAPSRAALLSHGEVRELVIDPAVLGIEPAPVEALRGGDAATNAAIVRSVLGGEPGPRADVVALNAGAALWVAERADSIADGVVRAREILASGRALDTLAALVRESHAAMGVSA
ncbi:MAG: anthranilate phosphoribosyltransferase [Deltaproteobacteria bacterium]|nr:anthranilate phosphoribosyltransferase [Deltaproteobacteria bacterium]